MIPFAAEIVFLLACIYAALSWMVPAYLLKPPRDNPDGELKLTMPRITRGLVVWLVIAVAVCAVLGAGLGFGV